MTSVAVTIGTYKLIEFAKLNVAMLRRIWGDDVPIHISDDLSHESPNISGFADDNGLSYTCSPSRRGHFCADLVALIHSVVFADSCSCDISIKLSQRMVPIHAGFRTAMERAFENPAVQIVLPGQPLTQQIARPSASFYSKFGCLSDCVAIRAGAVTGQELRDRYANAFENAKSHADSLIEVFMHRLIAEKFPGPASVLLPQWTNHTPFAPKLYLRKSQSLHADYVRAAAEVGLTGDFDLREWLQIEKNNYLCRPSCV